MSMDEQFHQMNAFIKELDQFNQLIRASWKDVESHHEQLFEQWHDDSLRQDEVMWEALNEKMQHYITKKGPHYLEFLSGKRNALERYLRGV